eukprot:1251344-Prymnesium_polylepis.1
MSSNGTLPGCRCSSGSSACTAGTFGAVEDGLCLQGSRCTGLGVETPCTRTPCRFRDRSESAQ